MLPKFNAWAADFKTVNFCCTSGHCEDCRDSQAVFSWLWSLAPNPFFTPEWWFYWCDAWIFVGSIVATYAMARGWNEFWLAWIGVDLVGVPFGFATGYVPTSVMYIFYGGFVLYGGQMPPFSYERLSDEDLGAVLSYLGVPAE